MKLDENFNQQEFTDWIEEFLPDFSRDIRKVDIPNGFTGVKSINTLGESGLNIRVYVIETDADPSKRKVGLATDSFSLLKNYASPNAIIAYYSKDAPLWRISLLTSTPIWSEGKIITKLSNPKRQSYVLGSKAKIKTPYQFLLSKGKIIDFVDLKSRFSLEVVNKEFYKEISQAFTRLVGGSVANGKSKKSFEPLLKLPFLQDRSQINLEFAVRLIGRIIFCWFLREKKSDQGKSLMPNDLLSLEAVRNNTDYYHKILEPIFFEVLNKLIKSRRGDYSSEPFSSIPYLNGGLFSPHEDDYYKRTNGDFQSQFHNTLVIPDEWLIKFFEVLETYNFTIDENTSFDEELSIDPEMLGRIFENLLAEINPETGESARKSTGSYYTPRIIVDYMIDESLLLYLIEKTGVEENKLRSLISYDLEDDKFNPLNENEKDGIIQALGSVKILDPACGSGAFPIGALQKIVFILQQIDQNGQLWFKKQIQNTPVELRNVLEREFQEKNFDYIRKLGIIRENIYGIDIQPIATEISRLRCFLTLVVDEWIDDSLENRGIEPLPNLDFKFVTANSLIGLPKIKLDQQELFDDNAKIDQLKSLRDQYFTAKNEERKDIMIAFSELQSEMINELIDEHSFIGASKAELTRKLTDWKPFKHKSTDWFDPEWIFGIKDGFDIIIANPPYVDSEQMVKSEPESREYYSQNFITAKGNWDLFVIFIEKGTNILHDNGILTFIIPNKLLSANYTKEIRQFLLTKSIREIRDYSRVGVFIDQDIYPVTLVLKNKKNESSDICKMTTMKNLEEVLQTNEINAQIFYQDIYWDKYFFDNNTLKLLLKIYQQQKLSQVTIAIHSAATVSEAYEIKKCIFDSEGKEGYKLINTGTIDKYSSFWGQKKTQYIKDNYIFPKISVTDLKNINGNREIQASSPKIIIAGMSKEIEAFLDEKGEYLAGKSTSIILGNISTLLALLGVLNSKLITFFVTHFYHSLKMAGGYLNIEPKIIESLPISSEMLDGQVGKYVHDLISSKTEKDKDKAEKQIDQLIYKLYDLTTEEIAIVEGNNEDN